MSKSQITDHMGRPVPSNNPWLWELTDSTGRPVRFGSKWLRQAVIPSSASPGPYTSWPGTLVVAQVGHPADRKRTVYIVRVGGLLTEGLWYPRGHYQQSLIVDAESLGPRYRHRLISRADKRAFKAAIHDAKEHWRAWAANCGDVSLYRSRFGKVLDYFSRPISSATKVMLESEVEICRLKDDRTGMDTGFGLSESSYLRETIIHPIVPNRIGITDLGPGKVVVAYAKISPRYQALMGMTRWQQRVWYIDLTIGDAKEHIDGHSPLSDSYAGCVDYLRTLNSTPGLPSLPFDPSTLQPISSDARGRLLGRKKELLASYCTQTPKENQ